MPARTAMSLGCPSSVVPDTDYGQRTTDNGVLTPTLQTPTGGFPIPIEIGQQAPDFALRNIDGEIVSLDDFKGRKSLIVFIPFPFTGTCEGELCTIRDRMAELNEIDANVVAITTDTLFSNRVWAEQNGFEFPVLSDFWPHGAVTDAYGTFDPKAGAANRTSFILDSEGVVRAVVATESRKFARDYDDYLAALKDI